MSVTLMTVQRIIEEYYGPAVGHHLQAKVQMHHDTDSFSFVMYCSSCSRIVKVTLTGNMLASAQHVKPFLQVLSSEIQRAWHGIPRCADGELLMTWGALRRIRNF